MDVQSDDIPPAGLVPLNTNEEILARVSQLLDADARQLPSVVVLFLDAKARELPVVVPLDGIPSRPDMPTVSNLCWIIAQVLDEHAPGCLYARVDAVEAEDRFVLMEVELVEPSLYLEHAPESAAAFARAVQRIT